MRDFLSQGTAGVKVPFDEVGQVLVVVVGGGRAERGKVLLWEQNRVAMETITMATK